MNQKALHTLEYDKIIRTLTEVAYSRDAKERCQTLLPMTDLSAIHTAQQQTHDALMRLFKKGSLSFSGIHPVEASVKRLEIGGSLSILEFLQIGSLLEAAKRAKQFGRTDPNETDRDSLAPLFEIIEPLTPLNEEIKRCILSEDEISDDASSVLKSIRRSIGGMNERIRGQINKIMNQANSNGYLQDAVITTRNGRYCIPVKAEAKHQVPGMVHDQSRNGSTLFIEPSAVVNLNNELKDLFLKEEKEIEVILAGLSSRVFEYAAFLRDNYRVLTELDFIFAKAQLAKLHNGSAPVFNTKGILHIRKGRHPLLNPKTVVPIDVILGDTFDLLIVTGPNTGGKTVSLKTVGLFTLMGQAGLHIPANDRSELAVFEDIFADIGDEQSIEQNLSTFSSHMTNIVSILNHANEKSLVLFDELCAGTDPTEGAALAISILSSLHERGIRTMATTHYSEIKVFALSTKGVENACCEFSVETLSPTYRLLIGIPGKSNAFAISSKLGLNDSFIEDAKARMTESETSFEDLIADLEISRSTIEREQEEIKLYKTQITALKEKLEQKHDRIDKNRDKIIREANDQASAILKEAKDYADQTIRTFQKIAQNHALASELEQERAKLRAKLEDTQKKASALPKSPAQNRKIPKNLRIGDSVMVLSMNLKGTVHTLPNAKGDLYVQMGILRSLVNIKDLELLEDETSYKTKKSGSAKTGKLRMGKSISVSTEINLIGKTTDEAVALLDKYLDDAYIAHLPSVRIVHGKGTGALRNAVQKHLKRQKYIRSFRLGEFGEGDAGVTIAEFKNE